jgi:hypothetical protein
MDLMQLPSRLDALDLCVALLSPAAEQGDAAAGRGGLVVQHMNRAAAEALRCPLLPSGSDSGARGAGAQVSGSPAAAWALLAADAAAQSWAEQVRRVRTSGTAAAHIPPL